MAQISEYLKQILEAKTGKDMTQAIFNSIDKINYENERMLNDESGYVAGCKGFADNASASAKAASESEKNVTSEVDAMNALEADIQTLLAQTTEQAEAVKEYYENTKLMYDEWKASTTPTP